MYRTAASIIILFWHYYICNGDTGQTTLEDSFVQIKCVSSFSPPWSWFGPKEGQHKTLAISGTKPHPKLNEPRYSFEKSGNDFVIKIQNVKLTDAGKFVCDGDDYQTTLLNVIR